jgi:arylsulfatase A-like enzyme
MPCAGNQVIRAPHLARLASESFYFKHTYCTQPLCTPSRGCVLTGLWPHHHGARGNDHPLRPDVRTLAEYLPADYVTGYFGKWHLGNEITPQHGFQHWRSIEDGYREFYSAGVDRNQRSDYHHFLLQRGYPPDQPDPAGGPPAFSRTLAAALPAPLTKSAFLARETERFLAERKGDAPFFLSVNFLEPHPPTYGPFNDAHDPATIPVGAAFGRPVEGDASRHHRRRCELVAREGYKNHPLNSESDWRRVRANYYGLVTLVDQAIGRILAALEASGQADNTIVVYTSDHGDMLGDHALMQKGVFYEQATRVPMLIRIPWLGRKSTVVNAPFSHIDLAPTLLDMMRPGVPAKLDGTSWAERLREPGKIAENAVVVVWNDAKHPGEAARCLVTPDRWKCTFYHDDAPTLYDLTADPDEMKNLGHDPAYRARIKSYASDVRRWQELVGDTLRLVV